MGMGGNEGGVICEVNKLASVLSDVPVMAHEHTTTPLWVLHKYKP